MIRKLVRINGYIPNEVETDRKYAMPRKKKTPEAIPFARVLKSLMKSRDLSIRQVSELAGVSPSVVQSWLEERNPHDLRAVANLATKLGISFKMLLLDDHEELGSGANHLHHHYEESDFFDGLAKISIKRLIPKKKDVK